MFDEEVLSEQGPDTATNARGSEATHESHQSLSNEPPPEYDGKSDYRTWKKKLRLWTKITRTPGHLQGARVWTRLSGRAWEALEALDVEDVEDDGGLEVIVDALDKRLLPEEETEMFDALEEVFYGEARKKGRKWPDHVTRVENSFRRLDRLKVSLPDEVKGFLALRKSGLKPDARVAVLSLTGGSLVMDKVRIALKRYADEYLREPAGSSKTVYAAQAEDYADEDTEAFALADEVEKHMEEEIEGALVALNQGPDDDYEEDDAAEILLAYKEARRGLQDHRLGRGYRHGPVAGRTANGRTYKIAGKLNLQELIARTRCKICRVKGHWARDCPNKGKGKAGKAGKGDHAKPDGAEPTFFVYMADSINEHVEEAYEGENDHELPKAGYGIIDTGCTKFLIGEETLNDWQDTLNEKYNLEIVRAPGKQKFKFGNGEVLVAKEIAQIPVGIGGISGIVRPYIIPGRTPMLISKGFLKALGGRVDLGTDKLELPKIGVTVEIEGGVGKHPTVNLMDFGPSGFRPTGEVGVASTIGVYKVTSISDSDLRIIPAEIRSFLEHRYEEHETDREPGADTWEETEQYWIRHHRTARRMLFIPQSAADGPDVQGLRPTRWTWGRYLAGGSSRTLTSTTNTTRWITCGRDARCSQSRQSRTRGTSRRTA